MEISPHLDWLDSRNLSLTPETEVQVATDNESFLSLLDVPVASEPDRTMEGVEVDACASPAIALSSDRHDSNELSLSSVLLEQQCVEIAQPDSLLVRHHDDDRRLNETIVLQTKLATGKMAYRALACSLQSGGAMSAECGQQSPRSDAFISTTAVSPTSVGQSSKEAHRFSPALADLLRGARIEDVTTDQMNAKRTLKEFESKGAEAAIWLDRNVKLLVGAEKATLLLRDYHLDDSRLKRLVEQALVIARQQGVLPQEVICNGRVVWSRQGSWR